MLRPLRVSRLFVVIGVNFSDTQALVLLADVISAVGDVAYIVLIVSTGAVFASQSAYAITVAGIAWSILLLDESLTI